MLQYAVDAWCHKSIGESYWTHGVDECLLWDGGPCGQRCKISSQSCKPGRHVGAHVAFTFDY